MFKLRIVQARFGDCLIVEYGTAAERRYTLIDGGPSEVYDDHLRSELDWIRAVGGKLDLVVLSHVDTDHVIGLLDLFSEIRDQRLNGKQETIEIEGLWHNQFGNTIDVGGEIELGLATLLTTAANAGILGNVGATLNGIRQGHALQRTAALHEVEINPQFGGRPILVDGAPGPVLLGNVSLRIVGPTRRNLEELRRDWLKWLEELADEVAGRDPHVSAMADRSVANLSSIMLLAESGGKRLLLTGDGRGDHLTAGLDQAGFLDAEGRIHVDAFKVPHHGSRRNVTKQFFEKITADVYVISADGTHGNPDPDTLNWIVESAAEQEREIEIVLTNETESTDQLSEDFDLEALGVTLRFLQRGENAVVVDLAP